MKYCKTTTENHPLSIRNSDCLEQIGQIVIREGGGKNTFASEQTALNLDLVERHITPAQPRATMDFTFGISCNQKNPFMVLAELKFRHKKSPKTISRRDLEDKVNGSISLLDRDITILGEYYFVFKDNIKEQARHHFRSIFSGRPGLTYIPLKLEELQSRFFSI